MRHRPRSLVLLIADRDIKAHGADGKESVDPSIAEVVACGVSCGQPICWDATYPLHMWSPRPLGSEQAHLGIFAPSRLHDLMVIKLPLSAHQEAPADKAVGVSRAVSTCAGSYVEATGRRRKRTEALTPTDISAAYQVGMPNSELVALIYRAQGDSSVLGNEADKLLANISNFVVLLKQLEVIPNNVGRGSAGGGPSAGRLASSIYHN